MAARETRPILSSFSPRRSEVRFSERRHSIPLVPSLEYANRAAMPRNVRELSTPAKQTGVWHCLVGRTCDSASRATERQSPKQASVIRRFIGIFLLPRLAPGCPGLVGVVARKSHIEVDSGVRPKRCSE